MKTKLVILLILAFWQHSKAQELPLILDKQGTFEILSRTDYTMPGFGFTKVEITANLQKIVELVNTIRKNPVLTAMKGFDGRARIYTVSTKDQEYYGIPARISFEFAAWYRTKDGKDVRGLIEPPEWSLTINKLVPGGQFSSDRLSSQPDFFTVPIKKETIEPGVDVYDGECYVVYNPNRPAYWLPVTVKEAFDVVFAESKKITDQIQRDFMMKYLNDEWNAIPKEDWNKPATLSGMVSRVGTNPDFPPIMKVNSAYWDKTLPKSDIQFINLRITGNKTFLEQRTKEYLKANSISYHEARFEESLNINTVLSLVSLIRK
jgi:hypothetical protein